MHIYFLIDLKIVAVAIHEFCPHVNGGLPVAVNRSFLFVSTFAIYTEEFYLYSVGIRSGNSPFWPTAAKKIALRNPYINYEVVNNIQVPG